MTWNIDNVHIDMMATTSRFALLLVVGANFCYLAMEQKVGTCSALDEGEFNEDRGRGRTPLTLANEGTSGRPSTPNQVPQKLALLTPKLPRPTIPSLSHWHAAVTAYPRRRPLLTVAPPPQALPTPTEPLYRNDIASRRNIRTIPGTRRGNFQSPSQRYGRRRPEREPGIRK